MAISRSWKGKETGSEKQSALQGKNLYFGWVGAETVDQLQLVDFRRDPIIFQ